MKKLFWISALAVLLSAATVAVLAINAKVEEEDEEDNIDDIDDEIKVEIKDWPQTKTLNLYWEFFIFPLLDIYINYDIIQ